MDYYSLVLLIHIAGGWAFTMTLIIMQLVVANVMKRIPQTEGKKDGQLFIQNKWLPVVDTIIVLVGLSAIQLFISNYNTIIDSKLLIIKITIGLIALISANINHFYFRYKKRRLMSTNDDPQKLKKVIKWIAILNKAALICAPVAALLGIYFNHS